MLKDNSHSQPLLTPWGTTIVILACTALALLICFSSNLSTPLLLSVKTIGTMDFQLLWSGVQVFLSGGNPYDQNATAEMQKLALASFPNDNAFVNPPWFLMIMPIFFAWDYEISRIVWLVLNFAMIVLGAGLLAKIFTDRQKEEAPYIWASVLSFPLASALHLGQLSIFLTFFLIVLLWSVKHSKNLLLSCSVIVLTVKPHLFLCVFIALAYQVLTTRNWRIIFYSLSVFAITCLSALLVQPSIFSYWQTTIAGYNIWQTPTLTSLVREFFWILHGPIPAWPMIAVPLLGVGLMLSILLVYRKVGLEILLFAILLSICFAPYAWLYDFVLLAPVQGYLAGRLWKQSRQKTLRTVLLFSLFLMQLCCIIMSLENTWAHLFVWYPWTLLVLYLIAQAWCLKSESVYSD